MKARGKLDLDLYIHSSHENEAKKSVSFGLSTVENDEVRKRTIQETTGIKADNFYDFVFYHYCNYTLVPIVGLCSL